MCRGKSNDLIYALARVSALVQLLRTAEFSLKNGSVDDNKAASLFSSMHALPRNLTESLTTEDCLDCTEEGRCLTSSWEQGFRTSLLGRVNSNLRGGGKDHPSSRLQQNSPCFQLTTIPQKRAVRVCSKSRWSLMVLLRSLLQLRAVVLKTRRTTFSWQKGRMNLLIRNSARFVTPATNAVSYSIAETNSLSARSVVGTDDQEEVIPNVQAFVEKVDIPYKTVVLQDA
jgi:hypothetical protein